MLNNNTESRGAGYGDLHFSSQHRFFFFERLQQ
jgi:hypothetical protein